MGKLRFKKDILQKIVIVGIFILLILLVFNLFNTFGLRGRIESRIIEIKELSRPAEVEMIIIKTDCADCLDINTVVTALKDTNLNITAEQSFSSSSQTAKDLAEKYGIEIFPTIILKGEIDKASVSGFELKDDALIFGGVTVPYVDASGEIRGVTTLTMITDNSCPECYDVTFHKQVLDRFNLFVKEEKTVDVSSSEGKVLIAKYSITKVPTVVISGDVSIYEGLTAVWKQVGTVENDGSYIFREMSAMGKIVYKDLSTGEIIK